MKKKRVFLIFVLFLFTATMVFSGGQGEEGTGEAEEKILRWAFSQDVYSLDPFGAASSFNLAFLDHVYDPLVRYNNDLEIEPALATSWEALEGDHWRFTLRKGVKFHNGNDFNADDVVASIDRCKHNDSALRGNIPAIVEARKVDDYTVDFILTGTYTLLLNDLTNIHMMDKEWMIENDCINPVDVTMGDTSYASTHANGTGPFYMDSWQPDNKAVFSVNPNWWDKAEHNLDGMVFTPITSDATRVASLLSGEVDFIYPMPLQDVNRVEQSPDHVAMVSPGLRTIWFSINQAPEEPNNSNLEGENPLRDVRVRKALYHAIDIESIHEKIMRGMSRNAGLYVAPEIPGYVEELDVRLPYDPEKAKELLAEAGYPNGFSIGLDVSQGNFVNDEQIGQAVTAMWSAVGVDARLSVNPPSIHWQKALGGKCDVWMLGWATLPMLDSYSVLAQILHKSTDQYGAYNPGGYDNPRVNELIQKVALELDEEKRLEMIREIWELALEDMPMIPLHQQPNGWATREGVHVIKTGDNKPRLWTATMD